jgi:hypothetical protein
MNSPASYSNTKVDKAINQEQFTQIVEAILAGKYSWACVLLLRFSGYNPLHYIPYRTYTRLTKEHCQAGRVGDRETHRLNVSNHQSESNGTSSHRGLSKINDLAVLEPVDEQHASIRGGNLEHWSSSKKPEQSSLESELVQYLNFKLLYF